MQQLAWVTQVVGFSGVIYALRRRTRTSARKTTVEQKIHTQDIGRIGNPHAGRQTRSKKQLKKTDQVKKTVGEDRPSQKNSWRR